MNANVTISTQGSAEHSYLGRRLCLMISAAVMVLGLTAPSALAGQPSREALEIPDVIELPAGAGCDFPVRIDILVNREINTTFEERDGETWVMTTGRLVVGVTNEWNDESVVLNISGPGLNVVHTDGSSTFTFYGKGLPFADGGLFVSSGPIVQEYSADGTLLSTSAPKGSALDLCAELG